MTGVLVNHVHPGSAAAPNSRPKKPCLTNPSSTTPKPARRVSISQPPYSSEHVALDVLARTLKGANNFVLSLRDGLAEPDREHKRKLEERRQILCLRMQSADSRKQWQDAAEELDLVEGNDQWKLDPSTADYQPELIEARLKELEEARTNCDIRTMLYLVRTALSRDLGGMGNVDLYRHSYIGTKDLIERYVDSAIQTVDALIDKSQYALPEGMSQRDILENLLYARQSFGRSALLLSGGGTFGMSHIGVLKALFEVKLLPRIISGASAGSIVCAVVCTRTDEEIPPLLKSFPFGDLSVFDATDKPDGVFDHVRRLLTEGSWSDIQHLTRVMRDLLGDMTFQEAYNRTRRILNICVSTESIYELPRLLNYVTAPNVMIWSAVAASCSVPLVFSAAPLLVKAPDTGKHIPWNPTPQRWIDGSVDNDLPMTRLAEMFNVNHFIVSQVNPHVVPFLAKDDHLNPATYHARETTESSSKDESDWMYTITSLAKEEALHRLQFLAEMGIFPNLATKLRSVLSQKYSGDINILPHMSMNDLPRLLSNPTVEFMQRVCLAGERATWPKLSRVRDRCAIELSLDRAVHRLRARVVFSDSQVDLRRLATGIAMPPPLYHTPQPAGAARPETQAISLDAHAPTTARHRRSSGSNVQLMAHHRRVLLENALTDEETEEEERLEMRARHDHSTGSPVLIRKPRLKRSAKSQSHFSSTYMRGITSGQSPLPTPQTPVNGNDSPTSAPNEAPQSDTASNRSHSLAPAITLRRSEPVGMTLWGGTTSPTDDLETSEMHSHSSDWGVDSETDDTVSDADPHDKSVLQGNPITGDESPETVKSNSSSVRNAVATPRANRSDAEDGGLWD